MSSHAIQQIVYSDKYYDDIYEYRHVILPTEIAKRVPKESLMSEQQWRALGVQQSRGWVHYARHRPEPHVLMFRREKGMGGPPPADSELFPVFK